MFLRFQRARDVGNAFVEQRSHRIERQPFWCLVLRPV